jgi:hypothetical protein
MYRTQLTATFRRDEVFIKSDCIFALIIVHANCVLNSTLHPFEAVSFNHYYSTNFLPHLQVMHVWYLRHGQ